MLVALHAVLGRDALLPTEARAPVSAREVLLAALITGQAQARAAAAKEAFVGDAVGVRNGAAPEAGLNAQAARCLALLGALGMGAGDGAVFATGRAFTLSVTRRVGAWMTA